MPKKELRKKVIGKNGLSNLLLVLKIVCDLIPQILLVYLISSLITVPDFMSCHATDFFACR